MKVQKNPHNNTIIIRFIMKDYVRLELFQPNEREKN